MKAPESLWTGFRVPALTGRRIACAFAAALITDAIQIGLGPLGWTFVDEVLDVLTMALTTVALGFHPLLLPTFVIELVPFVDMIPTWTGCVALVIMLRRRTQPSAPPVFTTTVESPPPPLPPARQLGDRPE